MATGMDAAKIISSRHTHSASIRASFDLFKQQQKNKLNTHERHISHTLLFKFVFQIKYRRELAKMWNAPLVQISF
jgi:hypothetical protein